MSKKREYRKSIILGFDETNNGFHIKSYNPYVSDTLVLTGYMTRGINRANYGSCMFESKRILFNGERNIKRALKRGCYYLQKHSDFLYTTIPKKAQETAPIAMLKANAIALLSFEFILRYKLNPSEVGIIMDEMDGESNSERVNYLLDIWISQAGLKIPHHSRRYADKRVVAVKKADRVGYYLSAIHFLGEKSKWPYRNKKLNLSRVGDKCLELVERLNAGEFDSEPQKYF